MRLIALTTALLGLAACGTETGNPELDMFSAARSSQPDAVGIEEEASTLRIDGAWVAFGDIRVVQSAACDGPGGAEADIDGPWVADLLGGPPQLLSVPDDEYCRVRVPMDAVRAPLPSGTPAQLEDASVFVEGQLADGTPFELVSRREPELDVRSRTAPFLLSDSQQALVLAFDMAVWLDGVDLSEGELDGSMLRIDEGNNDTLLEAVEDNIERSLELYEDSTGQGVVADGDTPLATSG